MVDSAVLKQGSYTFTGSKALNRGVYALVRQGREKSIGDFVIDGSQRFTITADENMTASTVKVKGSESNQQMFTYIATVQDAKKQMNDIRERKKNADSKVAAEEE